MSTPQVLTHEPPLRSSEKNSKSDWYNSDTMDDDEPVDPLTAIRATCGETKSCAAAMADYKACVDRVTNKGFGTCEPWFFDYVSCVDKCAAPKIMKATK